MQMPAITVLPAGAGVIPNDTYSAIPGRGAPRRCGGDPSIHDLYIADNACSPQVRG